jgi:beta-N-acetylhexosaminidase
MAIAASRSPDLATEVAQATAKELKAVGVNWILAPVIDVCADLDEPVVPVRCFSDNASDVAKMGKAFVNGLRLGGMASCAKHFGSVTKDGAAAAAAQSSVDEAAAAAPIIEPRLAVYQTIINEIGFDSVMVAPTILFDEDEERVARTLSFIHELLRRRLSYHGLIVSDCSEIPASSTRSSRIAPVRALEGGSDIILLNSAVETQEYGLEAVQTVVAGSETLRHAVVESSQRIAILKRHYLSWATSLSNVSFQLPPLLQEHAALARRAYTASTTLIRHSARTLSAFQHLLPSSVLILLTPVVRPLHDSSARTDPFEPLGRALAARHPRTRHVPYTTGNGITSTHVGFLQRAGAVVFVTCNSVRQPDEATEGRETGESALAAQLRAAHTVQAITASTPLVAIATCDPNDLLDQSEAFPTYLCTYEYSRLALEAAAEVIFGERAAEGRVPLAVPVKEEEMEEATEEATEMNY